MLSINLHQLIAGEVPAYAYVMKYLSICLPRLYPSSCIPLLPLPMFICSVLQLSYTFPKEGHIFQVLPAV